MRIYQVGLVVSCTIRVLRAALLPASDSSRDRPVIGDDVTSRSGSNPDATAAATIPRSGNCGASSSQASEKSSSRGFSSNRADTLVSEWGLSGGSVKVTVQPGELPWFPRGTTLVPCLGGDLAARISFPTASRYRFTAFDFPFFAVARWTLIAPINSSSSIASMTRRRLVEPRRASSVIPG